MGTTSRFALRYPGLTDAPSGPQLAQFLAEDVEGWLARAFPCTSTTRPTGVPEGFLIRESDTSKVWIYSGTTWVEIGGSSGGGGGGTPAVMGKWKASASQTLSTSGTDYVLAFGTTETSSSEVTRATSGTGHKFQLTAGVYAIMAMCRFAAGTNGSRFLAIRNAAQSVQYGASQHEGALASTRQVILPGERFSAGDEIVVIAAQSSGSSLSTQHEVARGAFTDPYVRLSITKISD